MPGFAVHVYGRPVDVHVAVHVDGGGGRDHDVCSGSYVQITRHVVGPAGNDRCSGSVIGIEGAERGGCGGGRENIHILGAGESAVYACFRCAVVSDGSQGGVRTAVDIAVDHGGAVEFNGVVGRVVAGDIGSYDGSGGGVVSPVAGGGPAGCGGVDHIDESVVDLDFVTAQESVLKNDSGRLGQSRDAC